MQKCSILFMLLCVLASGAFAQQGSDLSRKVGELSDKLAFASEGQILSVKGNTVYVDLGQKDGVVEGNRFEVVRLGEALMAGNQVIGHEETMVGEIEALRVRKDSLIATVKRKDVEVRKGDKVYQQKRKIRRVALTEFPVGNQLNDFTRNLQDLLYTHLTQKGMSVVEREKLEQVLREQKIAFSGIISEGVDVLYTFTPSSEGTQKGRVFSAFLEHYVVPEGTDYRRGQTRAITFTDIRPQ